MIDKCLADERVYDYLTAMNADGNRRAYCPLCGDRHRFYGYANSGTTVALICYTCQGSWVRTASKPYRIVSLSPATRGEAT